VLRGGAYNNEPQNLRSANRNRNEPENRNNDIGFRCVRSGAPDMPPGPNRNDPAPCSPAGALGSIPAPAFR
jgi:hypothetical protein